MDDVSKLANKQIIRKEMSNGWIIEEHFDQSRGLRNKYFYRGRRAPAIKMVDKISQQYAAYTLIEKDLRSVISWLEEINRLSPKNLDRLEDPTKMNIIKGLFVASLTFYAKCFTSCEGRKTKLERKNLSENYLPTHDHIMQLRHNFAAHSGAENFEEVNVSLVLHPNKKSSERANLYTELKQPDFFVSDELCFLSLAKYLQEQTLNKRNSVGEKVLDKIVYSEGIEHWYKKAKRV